MKKRVIIVGGGYGGVRVMQRLSSIEGLEILLIDQNPYHYLQTEAYALIANAVTITDVTVDLVGATLQDIETSGTIYCNFPFRASSGVAVRATWSAAQNTGPHHGGPGSDSFL